jgi:hypothetical protein
VFSPGDFVLHLRVDVPMMVRRFGERFHAARGAYVAQHPSPKEMAEVVGVVSRAYQWCLDTSP